jgi:hypothetical protein
MFRQAMIAVICCAGAGALAATAVAQEEYAAPSAPWGEPDLRGTWSTNHLISVPVVRPEQFGERFLLTDEELAEREVAIRQRAERFGAGPIPIADTSDIVPNQTSLIYDPPDGRFPELTAYGRELQETMRGTYHPDQSIYDDLGDFSSWDRCITRGLPVSMLPRNYNNGFRIFQSPGQVVIFIEMANETRIIPTDGREPLDSEIQQWLGESRGHWDGDTLVVETANFGHGTVIGLTSAGNPGSPGPLQPFSDNMRIEERFTRTADDTIE